MFGRREQPRDKDSEGALAGGAPDGGYSLEDLERGRVPLAAENNEVQTELSAAEKQQLDAAFAAIKNPEDPEALREALTLFSDLMEKSDRLELTNLQKERDHLSPEEISKDSGSEWRQERIAALHRRLKK